MLSDLPSRIERNTGRFAVLLNARAKQWTGDLHADLQRWVPAKDLFLTDDFRQAERTVDRLLAADYDVVFTGGGDGTIVYLVNAIEQRVRRGEVDRDTVPPVGVLRMGTGNALATYLEAGPPAEDLRRLKSGAPLTVYDVGMLESDEGLFPFAGFGWDALILNDYDGFKDAVRDTALENYATGLGGYALSVASRSIPNAIAQGRRDSRVTNLGSARRIDPAGQVVQTYEEGEVVFEGPVRVAAAATIPYWGFNIRMFPHCARLPGHFQFRAFNGTIPGVVLNLHKFWKGSFRAADCADFLCSHIRVDILDGAMPYHVAGDPGGYERMVEWKIADHPARLAVPLR